MTDLETMIAQVWSPDVRPLAEEAWRCYNAGAVRASIAATWTAVTADVITKLIRLADDGDNAVAPFRDKILEAQRQGLEGQGVRAMQNIESELLDKATEFELVDSIGARELVRIRQDRNLCVHPSLRNLGDVYEPRPEVARSHLAVALSALLVHPPTQGRKVLAEFVDYICDPFFVPALPHIQATFFDRVRTATRHTVVRFAAKHAVLQLDPNGRMDAAQHADRMAIALDAFAHRNRALVMAVMADQRERFALAESTVMLGTLSRLGGQDYFWNMVDNSLATRIQGLLEHQLPGSAPHGTHGAFFHLAVVRFDLARQRLPKLEGFFGRLHINDQMAIAGNWPSRYFVPMVVDALRTAGSWRGGESAGQLLLKHAHYLDPNDLRTALSHWADNSQCREASKMPEIAVMVFQDTNHLDGSRIEAFREFLINIKAKMQDGREPEEYKEYYEYPALAEVVNSWGSA
ncbi:hypothetical protein [Amycolatopsis sp. H20-H5]|uniref:hypothetical protein n=1 Tax=Amycolatopsis sp. H20-H5 TaxID=3046309 RepID=UPI002DBF8E3A|nr:hypothetical protein [Amycolatopsis sp. H20-H5]MEC3975785.1 hypothetical protein [Amycolatopsis sp. H20-H5]